MKFRAGAIYRYKRQRLLAWVRRKLFETPPEVVRPPKVVRLFDQDVRREKRRALTEANRRGDVATVKRLTRELTGR